MSSEECTTNKIIQKAENIAYVLLQHLVEEGGCNHKIDAIIEEAFGPSFEAQDQYQNRSNQVKGLLYENSQHRK